MLIVKSVPNFIQTEVINGIYVSLFSRLVAINILFEFDLGLIYSFV